MRSHCVHRGRTFHHHGHLTFARRARGARRVGRARGVRRPIRRRIRSVVIDDMTACGACSRAGSRASSGISGVSAAPVVRRGRALVTAIVCRRRVGRGRVLVAAIVSTVVRRGRVRGRRAFITTIVCRGSRGGSFGCTAARAADMRRRAARSVRTGMR